ncbi:acyltransferase family protein [Cerasicoccus fimbriatus]|uniref:acyltransferase family protein n=1 Tax=Cerasicoccus fimbriatus TaxID=3014554 RepID=UPI0022B44082|nr:acyltransferase [Cerasicoccus sp. TK19100]
MQRLSQLDGLRAYAVGAVVWAHWAPQGIHGDIGGTNIGAIGVQIFFVLSGFLITGILLDARFKQATPTPSSIVLRQFYIRRFLRIFPLYYATIFLMALLNIEPFRESIFWHATYLQNVYQQLTTRDIWGSHLWSLAVEEQFYLFWPILMLYVPRSKLLWLMFASIAISPISKIVVWSSSLQIDPNLLTFGVLDCFGVGALLSVLARQLSTDRMNTLAVWFIGVGVALFCLAQTEFIPLLALRQTGVALISGAIIWGASLGLGGPLGFMLQNKVAVYLGTISYGIYILHGLSLALWQWFYYSAPIPGYLIFSKLGIPDTLNENYWFLLFVKTAITLGLSVLSWHFFEKPLNHLKRHFPYIPKKTPENPSLETQPAKTR